MTIETILDNIDEILEKSWGVPLSGGKCVVDAEKVRDLIDEVRLFESARGVANRPVQPVEPVIRLEPIHTGKMPPQLALLSGTSAQIEEMAVEGSLTGNKEMIYQAICFDPLTASVCSLREIRSMVDEMFEANKEWLTQFK